MTRLLIMLVFVGVMDLYAYQSVRTLARNRTHGRWIRWGYWAVHGLFYSALAVVTILQLGGANLPSRVFYYLITAFVALYVPKLPLLVLLIGEDAYRLVRWGYRGIRMLIRRLMRPRPSPPSRSGRPLTRKEFLHLGGLALAGVPFLSIMYGIARQRFDFTVRPVRIVLPRLPAAFDGLTIVQVSDIHAGSFADADAVAAGIDLAMAQRPDLVLFTGDLVNNRATETEPFASIFARLQAPLGVYSVLGNHDYGDYARWRTPEEKAANLRRLEAMQQGFGWRLLRNEHVILERNGDRLALIGVENWSAHRGFSHYGRLDEAVKGMEDVPVRLLMSHDPSHWDAEVRPDYPDIDLTFSGHTHGFQFGVEIPGFRWSPVQYMYREWAGLYRQGKQYLYVNRGFGFLGFLGRVGISPEITRFQLVRG